MNNLNDLKTTDEFITHYYDELKRELKSQDLNISKVGVIGSILHVLGNLQFDIKGYYDGLFKEAFPISSTHDENLEQHAQTFNYIIQDSVAATLNGNIILNFDALPILPLMDAQTYKEFVREIKIEDLQFQIGTLGFLILSSYIIYIKYEKLDGVNVKKSYTYTYTDKSGISQNSSFVLTPNNNDSDGQGTGISIIDCYQIEKEDLLYTVPLYPFGSYYTIEIELDSLIHSLEISVKENNSKIFIPYDTSLKKIFSTSVDRCVFYTIITKNNTRYLSIELGSGIYGKYIPNSELNIVINKTQGEAGNIPTQKIVTSITGNVLVSDTYTYVNNKVEVIDYPINISNLKDFINLDISEGVGGANRLHGNDLRKSLISFIQSRDNLLNDLDFTNILSKSYKYFNFILKKVNFQDNLIMVYISCLDKTLLPEKLLTYSVPESNILAAQIQAPPLIIKPYYYHPTIIIFSKTFVSPFLYIYDSFLNVYKGYLAFENIIINRNDVSYTPVNVTSTIIPVTCPIFQLEVNVGVKQGLADSTILSTTFILNFQENDVNSDTRNQFSYKIILGNIEPNRTNFTLIDGDYFYVYPSLLIGSYDIVIELTHIASQYKYAVKFNNVQIIYDYSDFLVLKIYDDNVLDVPLIGSDEFASDKAFYLTNISSQLNLLYLRENRLMSDEIKLTFLNSYFIAGNYLSKISAQGYNTSLFFPLKVHINIIIQRDNSSIIVDLISDLKFKVAKFLNERTGNKIKFYSSELVELIHMESWIKHAAVKVYDATNLLIEDDNGESNIETYNIQDKLSLFTKNELISLSPPLFWWDINNIEISYKILGE